MSESGLQLNTYSSILTLWVLAVLKPFSSLLYTLVGRLLQFSFILFIVKFLKDVTFTSNSPIASSEQQKL